MQNWRLIRLVFAVVVAHEIQGSMFYLSESFRFREILLAFGLKIKANPQVFMNIYSGLLAARVLACTSLSV